MGRLTAVTGVSGSGKTTLVLESLVPALEAAACAARRCPSHVRARRRRGRDQGVKLIDATPIGVERALHRGHLRRTCYDDLRRLFAAHARGAKAPA